jgi:hypothetical protein
MSDPESAVPMIGLSGTGAVRRILLHAVNKCALRLGRSLVSLGEKARIKSRDYTLPFFEPTSAYDIPFYPQSVLPRAPI